METMQLKASFDKGRIEVSTVFVQDKYVPHFETMIFTQHADGTTTTSAPDWSFSPEGALQSHNYAVVNTMAQFIS